jgi:hypothetical protein
MKEKRNYVKIVKEKNRMINQFHIIGAVIGFFIGREIAYRIGNYIERKRWQKIMKITGGIAKIIGEPISSLSYPNFVEKVSNLKTRENNA